MEFLAQGSQLKSGKARTQGWLAEEAHSSLPVTLLLVSVTCGPATATSSGFQPEMQNLWSHLGSQDQNLHLTRFPGDSDA